MNEVDFILCSWIINNVCQFICQCKCLDWLIKLGHYIIMLINPYDIHLLERDKVMYVKSYAEGLKQECKPFFIVALIPACLLSSQVIVLPAYQLGNLHLLQIVKYHVLLLLNIFQDNFQFSLFGIVLITSTISWEESKQLDKIRIEIFPCGSDFGLFFIEFDSFFEYFLFSWVFEFDVIF